MKRIFILTIASIAFFAVSCKNDRGTVMNFPFWGESKEKDITSFVIDGRIGTINGTNITLTLPYGTDPSSLIAFFTVSGDINKTKVEVDSVPQQSGLTSNNFTNPVVYKITAADNSNQEYTVTVTVATNTAKDITEFIILGIRGTIGTNTIALTVPFGTDRSSLEPTITHTGITINPNSGVPRNFIDPVEYTVTAANSSTKVYTVTITVAANTAKDIIDFVIHGVHGAITSNAISLTVPYGSGLTNLTPTITITGASVNPASGVAQNFTSPVTYRVTAADGSTKNYTVTVTEALNPAKDITQFTILGINGSIGVDTIALTVPYGTDPSSLTPTITITGVSVDPASGVAQNFTSPVLYTVTAADSTTKTYTVTVTVALNPAKDITQFTILGINGSIGANTISLTVPYGTDRSNLTPTTIDITGISVSPGVNIAQDFTSPVVYTVTAADDSTKNYTVTVTEAPSPAKDITQFTILGINGSIGVDTIALTVPYGTDPSSLTPTITITGASVDPASGVAQDFTSPVVYTVTAANSTTKTYTVTVTVALNPAKDITQFTILGINGSIGVNTISLTVPYGTDRSNLTPTTIDITGISVSPGVNIAQDFTSPVVYTVTAADDSTKNYTLTVTEAPSPAKDITDFAILGIHGTIDVDTIELTVPYGTDRSSLTPAITITGASVDPASGVAQDFTSIVTYTVTAADSSTKDYTVTVFVAPSPAKNITQFTILGIDGTIGVDTIELAVPYGTDRSGLIPTITITGASVSPASGVAQNFTNPVTYTVTAADSSTKDYTVIVNIAASSEKDITQFTILGIDGTIGVDTVDLTVPYGTDRSSLTPTITITGENVNPTSGFAQDFTNPVIYRVTAADGTWKDYTVTVTEAPNTAKDITQFTILGIDGVIVDGGTTGTITVTVPYATPLTSLTPTIIYTGVSVSPDSGEAVDFTDPVVYTVTAEDSSTKEYTVTVIEEEL